MTNLLLLRQHQGLSKADAARLARVPLTDFSLIERGRLVPTERQAARLEEAFDFPIAVLLADVELPARRVEPPFLQASA